MTRRLVPSFGAGARRIGLVCVTLVLAHELVFLARYGSVYGEALAHAGHGQAWSDAVAIVVIGATLLLIGGIVGLWRLGRELTTKRLLIAQEPPARHQRPARLEIPRAAPGLVDAARGLGRRVGWLVPAVLVALSVQENLEHLAAGLEMPGPGILFSPEYPFAVAIVVGVAFAMSLVVTLLGWRRAALIARIRAASGRRGLRRRLLVDRPTASEPVSPSTNHLARRLGRRAPPVLRTV